MQVAYLLLYGNLPSAKELARFEEAVARHSAVPASVEEAIKALPHDAHFMGSILVGINALSTCHPEQNPALAGQDVYKSKEIQDKQIVRLIGTVWSFLLNCHWDAACMPLAYMSFCACLVCKPGKEKSLAGVVEFACFHSSALKGAGYV